MRAQVVAVVGPTAAGKSRLAISLARAVGGEIVNADSMQLYRGMDIGTAKLPPGERGGVPHHLLDVWDVRETASVAVYQRMARAVVDDITGRGRVAILAGGSGLYVRAVLDDLDFPGTDPALRARLEAELASLGPGPLHERLASIDPLAAAAILPGNGRRIVRALEVIALSGGGSFTATLPGHRPFYPAVQIGLSAGRAVLGKRILARAERMWAEGFVEEVRELASRGLREGRTASRAVGYAQVLRLLSGECGEQHAFADTVRATSRLARRQQYWFRRDPRVGWLDAGLDTADLTGLAVNMISSCDSRRGTAPRTTS